LGRGKKRTNVKTVHPLKDFLPFWEERRTPKLKPMLKKSLGEGNMEPIFSGKIRDVTFSPDTKAKLFGV